MESGTLFVEGFSQACVGPLDEGRRHKNRCPQRSQKAERAGSGAPAFTVSPNRARRRRRKKIPTVADRRHECWLTEALTRCRTDEQRKYVRTMDSYMNTGGEWFAGRERRARCLPPATDTRGRGRPNKRGHMSLVKLDKLERELVELGILGEKPEGTTNGYLRAETGLRARGIKVLRSSNSLMLRALQRFGFYFGRRFRRGKYRSAVVSERSQSVSLVWVKDGLNWTQVPVEGDEHAVPSEDSGVLDATSHTALPLRNQGNSGSTRPERSCSPFTAHEGVTV